LHSRGADIAPAPAMPAHQNQRQRRRDARQNSRGDPCQYTLARARLRAYFRPNTDHWSERLRQEQGSRNAGNAVDGTRHFDHTTAMRQHGTCFVLQLLHEPDNDVGFLDRGNFAYEPARNPQFLRSFPVHYPNLAPRDAAERPLVVLDANNGRVKREGAAAELVERRRNQRSSHFPIVVNVRRLRRAGLQYSSVRLFAILSALAVLLRAQAPQKIEKVCSTEDVLFFGLTCSEEDPCPVFLELASVEPSGSSLFLTGNLHTVNTTLFGLLLKSDDGGKTWTEPAKRIRSAALEQIQFPDFQHGFIGGVKLEPLPRDPFLMITEDGGTSWRQTPLFEESQPGSIQQFWFDSATNGQVILDTSQGAAKRYQRYETRTGGAAWEPQTVAVDRTQPARPRDYASWRIRLDRGAYRVERKTANSSESWETAASFAIQPGDCR
jgi:hypothetical protein